jgi:hypothetical protein
MGKVLEYYPQPLGTRPKKQMVVEEGIEGRTAAEQFYALAA